MGIDASLVLPISEVGPGTPATPLGMEPEGMATGYTKIKGPKIEPSPMVPPEIELTENQEARLINYLDSELSECWAERVNQIDKFARLKLKYRTKFPEFPKNFPIPNASQLTVPVIKTQVNTMTSRLHQTVMAADPLASIRTTDPDFQDFAFNLEEFLKRYDEEKLEMEEVLDTAVTECVKLGTSVVEVANYREVRKSVSYAVDTGYVQQQEETFNGPIVWNIPLEDFWIRTAWQDPDKAPWCGVEYRKHWSDIKDMAIAGELNPDKIDLIWNRVNTNLNVPATITQDEQLEVSEPHERAEYGLFRLFVRWDVDGDGIDEDLIVWYERWSRTLLRVRFNTYRKNRRPFEVFRYIKIEHRFYGEGMAEILEMLQEEISSLHNQRMDSNTVNMLKLILTSKSIQGLRPGDPLWPGKIIKVPSDATKDVHVLDLGAPLRDTSRDEQFALSYVSQVSGIGEVAMGQAQPVSRTTAAAQLSLLEELNRRFDKILKGFRRTIRRIHIQLVDLFNQSGTGGLAAMWLGDVKGNALEQYLALPPDVVGSVLKVVITSTKATVNREVEFQTNVALMNLIIQNAGELLPMVQQMAPQVLPMVVHEIVASLRPIYKKVLQYADYPDPDLGVRVLSFLEGILPAPENMGGMGGPPQMAAAPANGAPAVGGPPAQPSGSGLAPIPLGAPGMADIMSAIGQANGGRGVMAGNGQRR